MRFAIAAVMLLVLTASPGIAGSFEPRDSSPVTAGGLSCFTLAPPQAKGAGASRPALSCDELCGHHGAACTGVAVGAMNPPPGCSDRSITPLMASCRCCAVAK